MLPCVIVIRMVPFPRTRTFADDTLLTTPSPLTFTSPIATMCERPSIRRRMSPDARRWMEPSARTWTMPSYVPG